MSRRIRALIMSSRPHFVLTYPLISELSNGRTGVTLNVYHRVVLMYQVCKHLPNRLVMRLTSLRKHAFTPPAVSAVHTR